MYLIYSTNISPYFFQLNSQTYWCICTIWQDYYCKWWGFCIHKRLQTSFSLLWHQWPQKCCFSSPNSRVIVPEAPSSAAVRSRSSQFCSSSCPTCAVWGFTVVQKDHVSQITCLGCGSSTWEVSDSSVKRNWKWQFKNGYECRSPVSARRKFLNPYQDGNDASVCLWILLKHNGNFVEQMCYI